MKKMIRLREDEYLAFVKCENCGAEDNIAVQRGVTVREIIGTLECLNCACCELKQVTGEQLL